MHLADIQTVVQIVSSIVTTLAILTAGGWFFIGRSHAGTAQITLTFKNVTVIDSIWIAIVGVQIKNVGHTRIIKDRCTTVAKVLNVRSYSEPIHLLTEDLEYSEGREIFESLKEIEPNEEISGDILFVLNKATLFMVGVKLKRQGTTEVWQASAIFSATDKAKVLSTADLPTEQITSPE
jgi:hypothetical protein